MGLVCGDDLILRRCIECEYNPESNCKDKETKNRKHIGDVIYINWRGWCITSDGERKKICYILGMNGSYLYNPEKQL